jgi:uncharacterized protein
MASRPPETNTPSPRTLMTLGLFVFGMDTLAYNQFQRKRDWRHGKSERHNARAASQYLGPGEDAITIEGVLVPEVMGSYGAIDRLAEMAETGDNWPLTLAATGEVLGNYEIKNLDERWRNIMAGGLARQVDFAVDLVRVD